MSESCPDTALAAAHPQSRSDAEGVYTARKTTTALRVTHSQSLTHSHSLTVSQSVRALAVCGWRLTVSRSE